MTVYCVLNHFKDSSPSAETQEDERRAEQVVGAINAQRNASMKDIPSPSTNDSSPPFLKITKDFSQSDSCVIPPQAAEGEGEPSVPSVLRVRYLYTTVTTGHI